MSNTRRIQTTRTAVTFTVPGDPVPQPRPRVSTRGGYGRAYVPANHPVHEFRSRVAHAAQAAGLTQTTSPVAITIEATFGRPRSHYRKAGVKPTAPTLPRPDCDNLAKAVLDALQDVLGDDTKVSRLLVQKKWAADGYTKVEVASDAFLVVHEPEQEPLQETLAGKITKEPNNGKK